MFLPRLDKCFTLEGYESLDLAYESFLGYLEVEAYYSNAVVRVFVELASSRSTIPTSKASAIHDWLVLLHV